MALQRKQISAENALMRLEDLCARSEHCEYELREKLRQWNVPAGDATGVLATLRKARFYDNRRFAEAFVRDKLIYNRWGKRKIFIGSTSENGLTATSLQMLSTQSMMRTMKRFFIAFLRPKRAL